MSPSLAAFLHEHAERLALDGIVGLDEFFDFFNGAFGQCQHNPSFMSIKSSPEMSYIVNPSKVMYNRTLEEDRI